MSSGGDGGSRVWIPADLQKTIQNIREISGKQHSDEDIFAVLNDCFNDPHETAQKLLYLDTFHEVRSKRDRKKESSVPSTQARGISRRRNYGSGYISPRDAGNGRNTTFKKESGANHITGGPKSALSAPNKARNNAVPGAVKVSNGPTSLPNRGSNHKIEDDSTTAANQPVAVEQPLCKSTSGSEVSVEPEKSKASSDLGAAPVSVSGVQSHIQDALDESFSGILKPVVNNQPAELQSSSFSDQGPSLVVTSNHHDHSVQVAAREAAADMDKGETQLLPESDTSERPHVIFPAHFLVAKALENGLTFGSFDSKFAIESSYNNGSVEGNYPNVESSHGTEDDARESSPTIDDICGDASSSQSVSTFAPGEDHDSSKLASSVELVLHSDHIVPPVEDSEGDEPQQEAVSNAETREILSGQNFPSNGFGFIPSLSATGQSVNTEAPETQILNPKFPAISNPTSTDHNSVAVSQQAIHLFRQQYPPNFFPYGPYFSPFYMPQPHVHHFLSPNGLPQQSYLPPGAAAATATAPGVKLPFPQFKAAANPGNPPPPATIPSAYGSYGSSPVAFSPIPSATSINSIHKEDLSTSQLKENVYTTGPLSDSAAAWMAAHGQNLSNLQVNPVYNLALQSQHLAFSPLQAGHGGYVGIYQPTQTVAAASTANQTLQPSHTTAAMAETLGPPPVAYQQPQVAQSNWSSNY